MTAHTPGPWTYRPMPEPDSAHTYWIDGPHGEPVAEVCEFRPDDSANDANARLIAAAPELLAALQRLARQAEASPTWAEHDGEISLRGDRAMARLSALTAARAAIAKTEGGVA